MVVISRGRPGRSIDREGGSSCRLKESIMQNHRDMRRTPENLRNVIMMTMTVICNKLEDCCWTVRRKE